MTREKFIKRILQLMATGAFPFLYSWQIEPFWLEIVYKTINIKNLPENLAGKTIMQISDLHVGNRFDWNFLIESFEKVRKLNPDFVVYTGDFVNVGNAKEQNDLKTVLDHAVLGKLGTVGILGNHDYGRNWRENKVANDIKSIGENAGIKMLINEDIEISGLNFIGLGD